MKAKALNVYAYYDGPTVFTAIMGDDFPLLQGTLLLFRDRWYAYRVPGSDDGVREFQSDMLNKDFEPIVLREDEVDFSEADY